MATFIFPDFAAFKAHAGGAVNQSLEIDSIKPVIEEVANTYIIPWLTQELWDALVAQVATPATPPAGNHLIALLPYVQKPLTLLTMWEYAKIGGVQFSEAGLMRAESETHKTAYKYQENAYREQMRDHGFNALERMLAFLEKNKADYADWTATGGGFEKHREVFLNYAAAMQGFSMHKISRYTYQIMRPLIADLETFVLEPLLGESFLTDLRTKFLADTLTDKHKALLQLLRKSLTQFTVAEATQRMWVQISGDTIVQREALEPQSYQQEGVPGANAVGPLIDINSQWGNRHLSYVRKYLTDNIDHADFDLYKTYQEELTAAALAAAEGPSLERATETNRLSNIQTPTVDVTDYGRAPSKGTFRF